MTNVYWGHVQTVINIDEVQRGGKLILSQNPTSVCSEMTKHTLRLDFSLNHDRHTVEVFDCLNEP